MKIYFVSYVKVIDSIGESGSCDDRHFHFSNIEDTRKKFQDLVEDSIKNLIDEENVDYDSIDEYIENENIDVEKDSSFYWVDFGEYKEIKISIEEVEI